MACCSDFVARNAVRVTEGRSPKGSSAFRVSGRRWSGLKLETETISGLAVQRAKCVAIFGVRDRRLAVDGEEVPVACEDSFVSRRPDEFVAVGPSVMCLEQKAILIASIPDQKVYLAWKPSGEKKSSFAR